MMVSQRNLGLMLAATAGALPAMTWLYFVLTQFRTISRRTSWRRSRNA
jgi:hypothetical protein